jgi:MoaA/NifB/PqqE/SkfB family radical SAM enzyme
MCIRHAWQQASESMERATYENLLAQLRGIPSVSTLNIGGFGEPLVHPDCLGIVRQAKQAGLSVELVTNGVLLDRTTAEALVELRLDRLFVSLDSAGARHDSTFHDDTTSQVRTNLQWLYRTKALLRAHAPEVAVVLVASRRNVDQVPAVRRLARELGVSRILVTNLIPYTPELEPDVLYGRWTTNCRNRTPSPWNPAIDFPRVDARSEATRILDQLAAHGSDVSVNGASLSGGFMDCRFVREGRLAIDPVGRVSPCLPLLHAYSYYFRGERHAVRPFHLGNVGQVPLGEIWSGAHYRALRERLRTFDFSPCIDCGGCDLRATNEDDCYGSGFPSCGDCLWAAGFIQCP